MDLQPSQPEAARPEMLSPNRPVAGYLRSATQLEADSLRKQLEAIVRYARDRGMQLIRIYCHECSSGQRIDVPSALRQMLRDIETGAGDFDAILLLDPGRWGRFHTPDQSACLEYACREAGTEVHYCARGLDKDQAPVSAIVKSMKRAVARECARDLTTRRRHTANAAASETTAEDCATALGRSEDDDGKRSWVSRKARP